jgi:hypothetical protein
MFGDAVAASADTLLDTEDRELFWNQQHMEVNGESRGVRFSDQGELRGMGEDGLSDERLSRLNQSRSGLGCNSSGVIGSGLALIWPEMLRDLIGVDEDAARQPRLERDGYE